MMSDGAKSTVAAAGKTMSPITFYFDFTSPYAYLGACRIDDLARLYDRDVDWRPMLLGVIFRQTSTAPLFEQPLKGDYAMQDLHRCARALGVPINLPDPMPFSSVPAARAFLWMKDRDDALARRVGRAYFDAAFGAGRDISSPETVVEIAAEHGVDGPALLSALGEDEIKARLRTEVEAAISAGVFGAPFFVVDGEPFWGADRMDHLERWLASGGW